MVARDDELELGGAGCEGLERAAVVEEPADLGQIAAVEHDVGGWEGGWGWEGVVVGV